MKKLFTLLLLLLCTHFAGLTAFAQETAAPAPPAPAETTPAPAAPEKTPFESDVYN
jgi:hypothetical protein